MLLNVATTNVRRQCREDEFSVSLWWK